MNLKYILYIIIFIQIFILYKKKEKFTKTVDDVDDVDEIDEEDDKALTNINSEELTNLKNITEELYNKDLEDIKYIFKLGEDILNKPFNIYRKLNVTGYLNLFPKGVIVIYNNTTAPKGWALCDGTNGTPDLRGRFIRMWNDTEKDFKPSDKINNLNFKTQSKSLDTCKLLKHNINTIGGSDLYKITDVRYLPKHTHNVSKVENHSHNFDIQLYDKDTWMESGKPYAYNNRVGNENNIKFTKDNNHTHTVSKYGVTDPKYITNHPPYYTLTYIMKL